MSRPVLLGPWRLGLVLALAALAGCASVNDDSTAAERQELANLPLWAWVPATKPATLVKSFRHFCIETPNDPARRTAVLRAADYIPTGGWNNGIRHFVSGTDRLPMVSLSDTGRLCAVRARARPGQSNAILREIAEAYPDARPMPPSASYDAAWLISPDEMIALLRHPHSTGQNEFTIALTRQ